MIDAQPPAVSAYLAILDRVAETYQRSWDAIAVYDLEGRLISANEAAYELLGRERSAELIGQHFLAHMSLDVARPAARAFAQCVTTGAVVESDTTFRTANDLPIAVRVRLVPARLDDVIVGVIGFARDTRRERESARGARRIGDLYRIAAAPGMSPDDKIPSALAIARSELRASGAFAARRRDDALTVTHVSGEVNDGIVAGLPLPASAPVALAAIGTTEPFAVDDAHGRRWIGVPLRVGGLIGFVLPDGHAHFDDAERDYMETIGTLIGSALQQAERDKRLDMLAFHDPLTGLPNRALFGDRLERALLTARRNRRLFAVHYVDIDYFKKINDAHGHHVGDEVLIAVARWLLANVRESDTVARIGGDEFVVLQPEIESAAQAEEVAARLVTIHDRPLSIVDREIPIRLSVGVAVFPENVTTSVDMLHAADEMLYEVKKAGRDAYRVRAI